VALKVYFSFVNENSSRSRISSCHVYSLHVVDYGMLRMVALKVYFSCLKENSVHRA